MLPIYQFNQFKGRVFFNRIRTDEFSFCAAQDNQLVN
jgi:hypothetical protein